MKLLWSYLKRYRWTMVGALVLATINQVFSLLDPQIFRILVDRYGTHAADYTTATFLSGVVAGLAGLVGVAFVSRVAKSFQDYYVSTVTQKVGTGLYADSVKHAFSLPYASFEDQRSGELLQKLQKARTDVQTVVLSAVNIIFLSLVGVIFVIIYAFTVHAYVAWAYVAIIPTLGTITTLLSKRIKAIQTKIVRQTADLAGSTTETLRNVEIVKSLGLEEQEIKRLNLVNDQILQLDMSKIKLVRTLSFIQGTITNAMRAGLLFLMLWLVFTGSMSIGELFTLFIYSFFIFGPLGEFGNLAAQYQEARASLEIMEGVLSAEPEAQPANPQTVGAVNSVEFKDTVFAYASVDHDAIKQVNLSIKSGETVAFVGPSGSGKTTMVKLLVGLYKPTGGSILFNGVDNREIDYAAFRQTLGLVSQETQLFAGTIRDNLVFVRPGATDEECLKALEQASALSIIDRGDKGLDTRIGEGGIKISGGERQRLAIARALLRQPSMIIFDEATSSLDSITEKSVSETIRAVSNDRSGIISVLVAHRLSTVIHADTIFVMERGRIVESGSHDELVAMGGLYAALWRQQSGQESEA